MNLISIETQKKLMYLPVVNILNFWVLFINLMRAKVSDGRVMKAVMYPFCHTVPIWFVCTALSRMFPGIAFLFGLGIVYLCPIAMSYGSIKFQEKYLF